jgi:hypothetical protein
VTSKVDCKDYIENYLSAHADGELNGEQSHAAHEHLNRCSGDCRFQLSEELALKAQLRHYGKLLRAPDRLRARIDAALDQPDPQPFAARNGAGGPAHRPLPGATDRAGTDRRRQGMRPRWLWVPVALAASGLLAFVVGHRLMGYFVSAREASVPAFEFAIDKYQQFGTEAGFQPNVPQDAYADSSGVYYAWMGDRNAGMQTTDAIIDVARSYQAARMPFKVWNFEPVGYGLVGGRIDRLADGRLVTYTYYRSDLDAILCIQFRNTLTKLPSGAAFRLHGHTFYNYKGYTICLTPSAARHYMSILVSPAPVNEFVQDVAFAGG